MIITILAKNDDGTLASLHITSDAEWMALEAADISKMQTFFPSEVFEISVSNNKPEYLRQGCKVDFAYKLT